MLRVDERGGCAPWADGRAECDARWRAAWGRLRAPLRRSAAAGKFAARWRWHDWSRAGSRDWRALHALAEHAMAATLSWQDLRVGCESVWAETAAALAAAPAPYPRRAAALLGWLRECGAPRERGTAQDLRRARGWAAEPADAGTAAVAEDVWMRLCLLLESAIARTMPEVEHDALTIGWLWPGGAILGMSGLLSAPLPPVALSAARPWLCTWRGRATDAFDWPELEAWFRLRFAALWRDRHGLLESSLRREDHVDRRLREGEAPPGALYQDPRGAPGESCAAAWYAFVDAAPRGRALDYELHRLLGEREAEPRHWARLALCAERWLDDQGLVVATRGAGPVDRWLGEDEPLLVRDAAGWL